MWVYKNVYKPWELWLKNTEKNTTVIKELLFPLRSNKNSLVSFIEISGDSIKGADINTLCLSLLLLSV